MKKKLFVILAVSFVLFSGEIYFKTPIASARTLEELMSAADQGDAKAQHSLGLRYDHGTLVPHDGAQAAKWYRKSAEQGNADAQYNLGQLYHHGRGVVQDFAEAYFWLNLAAAQNPEFSTMRDYVAQMLPSDILVATQKRVREWQIGTAE